MMMAPTPLALAAYATLWAAMLCLWFPFVRGAWPWLGALSVGLALASNVLSLPALVFIVLLLFAAYTIGADVPRGPNLALWISVVVAALLGTALSLHITPGFNNLVLARGLQLSEDAVSYSLKWNYDKGILGLALLALCVNVQQPPAKPVVLSVVGGTTILVLIIMPLGIMADFFAFEPKRPGILTWWIPANLLLVSVGEEALFRGLLQKRLLETWLRERLPHGQWVAVLMAAVVFGGGHLAGGPIYACLATIAGIGYGAVYLRTGRIEASILTHFLFNLVHITLFTYPWLTPAHLLAPAMGMDGG